MYDKVKKKKEVFSSIIRELGVQDQSIDLYLFLL